MRNAPGFTLLELSIVLVVIGLIAGGITVGESLIHAGKTRALTRDFQNYQSATNIFRTKYEYYPGDFPKATSIWGAVSATPGTCYVTQGTGTQTCDGDGDGQINDDTPHTYHERHRYWQHLALAGLIKGTYTGIAPSGYTAGHVRPGYNSPKASYSDGAGFNMAFYDPGNGDPGWGFFPVFGNTLSYGKERTISDSEALYGAVVPSDAQSIDTKIDDGKPGTGLLVGPESSGTWLNTNCVTTSVPATAQWDITKSGPNCTLWLVVGN